MIALLRQTGHGVALFFAMVAAGLWLGPALLLVGAAIVMKQT